VPCFGVCFFISSRRRHTRSKRDWSSDVCSSDLDLLPEKPEGITKEIIDDYETRMAPWEHDEAEETQILDEALDAHHGQIDMLMRSEERRVGKESRAG